MPPEPRKVFGRLQWYLAIATAADNGGTFDGCNAGGKPRQTIAPLVEDWFDISKSAQALPISEQLLSEFIRGSGGGGLGWQSWMKDAATRTYIARVIATNLALPDMIEELQLIQTSGVMNFNLMHVALRLLYEIDNTPTKEHYHMVLSVWSCYSDLVFERASVSSIHGLTQPWLALPVLQLIQFDATQPVRCSRAGPATLRTQPSHRLHQGTTCHLHVSTLVGVH